MPTVRILQGHVLDTLRQLPNQSVHCCITSPPYWGLRSYQTEPQIWNGTDGCEHVWGPEQPKPGSEYREGLSTSIFAGREDKGEIRKRLVGNAPSEKSTLVGGGKHRPGTKYAQNEEYATGGQFCQRCGAWRGESGSEPTPELYVEHLVLVFREVWRVVRSDGVIFVNMGDTYASGKGTCYNPGGGPGSIVQDKKDAGAYQLDRGSVVTLRKSGLKPKDLCGMPWRLAFALQADGWWLRSDVIWHKCLSGGTVLWANTQKGVMPSTIKDLARLRPETIQLWNGERWTRVVSWGKTSRPAHPLEIELRSGQRIGCTAEHRWPTRTGLRRTDELVVGDVIQHVTLPDTESLGCYALPLSVARVIGWYLAEGSKSGDTLQFSLHADERWISSDLRRFAEFYGCSHHEHVYGNSLHICLEGRMVNAVIDTFVASKGSHLKHLTNAAWQRDNNFLADVLRGYLEGDGHHCTDTDEWRLGFCNNDVLASDLRTICARLGWSIRLKRTMHKCAGKSFPGYRGRSRKDDLRNNDCKVVAIRPSRARFFYDVQVEDDPHVFALASGVLTHNSNPMPESCTDRPTKSHEYVFLLTKSAKYYYDAEAVKEPQQEISLRRAYSTNHVGDRKDAGQSQYAIGGEAQDKTYASLRKRLEMGENVGRNLRSVWTISTEANPLAHFATFPRRLVEPCILAGSSERGVCPACGAAWARVVEKTYAATDRVPAPNKGNTRENGNRAANMTGDGFIPNREQHCKTLSWRPTCSCPAADPVPATVLDPFSGVGTTGIVAVMLNRNYIGLELNPEYVKMSLNRIRADCGMLAQIETEVK